ncbi:MAG TPA: sigma-54 dependent transcriptional regulator [Patescibacteria group bacterium]|nr:sigma-54 dependent transcriptional regulator [Patescibacteria group bacterium]
MESRSDRRLSVAIIDDEACTLEVIQAMLRHDGIEARVFSSAQAFLAGKSGTCDLILCDLQMPGMSGLELLSAVRRTDARARFVIMTGVGTLEAAVAAMKKGATDFLAKPIRMTQIQALVKEAEAGGGHEDRPGSAVVVGSSLPWRLLLERARRVANLPTTVLIRGETGSGKEVLARYLVSVGPRAGRPFVVVNCAAVPAGLLESELFGHARGAFSGADVARRGLIEEANGGTLFLDEAGSMGLTAQIKLLRVLEDGEVRRIGENRSSFADVRFVAATNLDLEQAILKSLFRADLYFRLAVVTLQVPPLRDRREDIPLLVDHFVKSLTPAGQARKRLSPDALSLLMRHPFPGNVRELKNAIEQALIFSNGSELTCEDFVELSTAIQPRPGSGPERTPERITPEMVRDALAQTNGNRVEATKLLGVSRSTLYRVLRLSGMSQKM